LAALVALVAVLVAVGCSGASDEDAGPTTTSVPTPEEMGEVPATAESTPPVGVEVMPPVPVGQPTEFDPGVSARVVEVDEVQVKALGAGETSGPALAVTVEMTNASDGPVDLSGLAVTARTLDGVPAVSSRAEPAEELVGVLQPDQSATGTYVFRVSDDRPDVLVELSHSSFARVLTFRV
jgi:hypothetical protein